MAWHGMAWDNLTHIIKQHGVEWDNMLHITNSMMAWPSIFYVPSSYGRGM